MDTTSKPGHHLAPVPTPSTPPKVKRADFLDYAAVARSHARAAHLFLADAEQVVLDVSEGCASTFDTDRAETLIVAAQAHALTSLAFTQLNPPPRRRPITPVRGKK